MSNNTANNKTGKIIIIASTVVAVIAIVAAVIVVLSSSGKKLKQCLDLGQKYLNELNYEEAIACFENALEIDPMSADAYIGIADAYLGMADASCEAGDYDEAISLLNTAKKKLEEGIEILTEYADANSGKKAANAKSDAERLTEKMEEIDSEIAEIDAKTIEINDENASIEEEENNDSLPYIELRPIVDSITDVWGRKWDEWTEEDFRAAFNIQTYSNKKHDGGKPYEGSSDWIDDKHGPQYMVVRYDDTVVLFEQAWNGKGVGPNNIIGSECVTVSISNGDYPCYSYIQLIVPEAECYIPGNLYDFAAANGIKDIESFCAYLGLEDVVDGMEVNTDYGAATIAISGEGTDKSLSIDLNDAKTNPEIGDVFIYQNKKEGYETGVSMGISKCR